MKEGRKKTNKQSNCRIKTRTEKWNKWKCQPSRRERFSVPSVWRFGQPTIISESWHFDLFGRNDRPTNWVTLMVAVRFQDLNLKWLGMVENRAMFFPGSWGMFFKEDLFFIAPRSLSNSTHPLDIDIIQLRFIVATNLSLSVFTSLSFV